MNPISTTPSVQIELNVTSLVDNRNNTRMDFMAQVKGAISHHSSVIASVQIYLRDLEIIVQN